MSPALQNSSKKLFGFSILLLLLAGCEAPPPVSEQQGFRGTAIVDVKSEARIAAQDAANTVPDPLPAMPAAGPKAGELYQNVKVLGDLSVGEFTRVMSAMTAWVSPDEGCLYCHAGADMASDDLYTKVVARRMLEMTRDINSASSAHVGETGVTCYTCHRGKNVPEELWFSSPNEPGVFAGNRAGQNEPSGVPAYAAMHVDPFTDLLGADGTIRVASKDALPTGNPRTIKDTEKTYSLMMHISDALGENCTFCHDSRAFSDWEQSSPARVTAWHGIEMVQGLNQEYLSPLGSVLPENRLGPHGEIPQLNCATCHQGVNKPLKGVSMLKDYPSLKK